MNKLNFEEAHFSQNARFQRVNKDFYGIYSGQYGKIYIVARGIGQEGAELISDLVVMTIKNFFEKLPQKYNSFIALRQAIQKATKEVLSYISDHRWLSNCGASVAILLSNINGIYLANAGDCRILLHRRKKITCLSPQNQKHWTLDEGNYLNTIGLTQVEPEISECVKLYKDDLVFLTTKGVYQRVTRVEITKALEQKSLKNCLTMLWDFAKNKKSGEDFTIIALKVVKATPLPKEVLPHIPIAKNEIFIAISLFILSLIILYFTFIPFIDDIKALFL